ncbi:MAG: DUF5320 domain-containing protein [Sphaerochaetaceae bacterium]|nr:DUF5320 domain-containing protein [Sphaerochaetaceae bacterium]
MPRGDRTGPDGYGPATGRGLGYCTGHLSPGFTFGGGRGCGRGFGGFGRGFRRGYPYPGNWGYNAVAAYPPATGIDEARVLEDRAKAVEEELQAIKARLDELSSKGE